MSAADDILAATRRYAENVRRPSATPPVLEPWLYDMLTDEKHPETAAWARRTFERMDTDEPLPTSGC